MIQKGVLLKDYNNYKVGGPAAFFLEVSSVDQLKKDLKEWESIASKGQYETPFVLAAGSNVLIDDKGYNGLVIHNKIEGIEKKDAVIVVRSGVLVSDFLKFCIANSLSGFEWAGGLPGTIGGAVRGNAGAFKGETKDLLIEAKSLNIKTLQLSTRNNKDCSFSYRYSFYKSLKGKDEIITEASFQLAPGNKEEIAKKINEKIQIRKEKHPMEYPTLGSTFKNVPYDSLPENLKEEFKDSIKYDPMPIIPVVKFLSLCGLSEKTVGDAQFSKKHTNFIINLGNATSNDVKALIRIAKDAVLQKFGLKIEEEIAYLGVKDNGR